VEAARKAADFVLRELRTSDGKLMHTWRSGVAKLDAYLDDYASLANALMTLYETTLDEKYIDRACELLDILQSKFADPVGGGFFFTSDDHEELIARTKELTDSSIPSGNALAATALLRLGKLLGRRDYLDAAERTLAAAAGVMERAPTAAGQMLLALDLYLGPAHELVLVGDGSRGALAIVQADFHALFLPRCVLAARESVARDRHTRSAALDDIFTGKTSESGTPALYVCEEFACQAPVIGQEEIRQRLVDLSCDRT
jgi:uncharacterized protein YyaL (SSP411 family)